ncbi:MAG TPA: glycine zipper 2TM domain-containing protein [Gemmatimonadaceae bacterium]|nr:glycine zipper 2TM domain-containing protein [Gemmatimonadaceae bacterium]
MSRHANLLAPLALSLALFAGACKNDNAKNNLAQDSTLSRDLQLANKDTSAQPQLQDVPPNTTATAAPAPAAPSRSSSSSGTTTRRRTRTSTPSTPAPTTTRSGNTVERGTKGSEGAVATIPAGTMISLASSDRICTNTNKPGDRFTATVSDAVTGSNGAVIPAGAKAVIQVTSLKKSNNATDPVQMAFNVVSLSWNGKTYPVDAVIDHVDVEKVRNSSKGNDAKKVVGGAVIGAILGQVIGHNTKSTVIGAAGGAAAGTAVAMGTADYEGCIPQGGAIRIKLNSPTTVTTE